MAKWPRVLAIFTLCALCIQAFAAEPFDELYDKNGKLRPQYLILEPYLENATPQQMRAFIKRSKKSFLKDNALYPVPRILTKDEYVLLRQGVEQRAKALRAFLQDHYSERRYLREGVIPGDVVDRIVFRNGNSGYDGLVWPEQIRFMYGPDIVRGADGKFYVIEDNVGFLGGFGDLKLAYDLAVKEHPQLREEWEVQNPRRFYEQLARSWQEEAMKFGGKAVYLQFPPYDDHEDVRLREILESVGIEVISTRGPTKLVIEKDGVYTQLKTGGRKVKVGFAAFLTEHAWLDAGYFPNKLNWVVENALEYLRDGRTAEKTKARLNEILRNPRDGAGKFRNEELYKFLSEKIDYNFRPTFGSGLTEAILNGLVGSSYSPGVDFVCDKEFYLYAEDLIRFYLGEEPILRNIPTERFVHARTKALRRAFMAKVFANSRRYVLKDTVGRGGDAVFVGPRIRRSQFNLARPKIESNPEAFIAQRFTPMSVFQGSIVDLRLLAYVGDGNIFTGVPWGRGAPASGDGKVNLSKKGVELAILVAGCEDLLSTTPGDNE